MNTKLPDQNELAKIFKDKGMVIEESKDFSADFYIKLNKTKFSKILIANIKNIKGDIKGYSIKEIKVGKNNIKNMYDYKAAVYKNKLSTITKEIEKICKQMEGWY